MSWDTATGRYCTVRRSRPIALGVLWPAVDASVEVVVAEVPRRARFNPLPATGAVDLAPLDLRCPPSAQLGVLCSVPAHSGRQPLGVLSPTLGPVDDEATGCAVPGVR